MVREGISIIWQTALSVIDVGSSILYHLLGRDLSSEDIALVEKMFIYMEYDPGAEIIFKTSFYESKTESLEELEDEYLNKFIRFLKELQKGKDLLLVTNKSNGYNILQTGISNILQYATKLLRNTRTSKCETNYMNMIQSRMQLIKALLEYGSDPNRGLVLANKKKLTIDNNLFFIREHNHGKSAHMDKNQNCEIYPNYSDSDSSDSIMPTDLTHVSYNFDTSQNLEPSNLTPIDSPLLLICCLYNCDNLLSLSKDYSRFESKTRNISTNQHTNENNYEYEAESLDISINHSQHFETDVLKDKKSLNADDTESHCSSSTATKSSKPYETENSSKIGTVYSSDDSNIEDESSKIDFGSYSPIENERKNESSTSEEEYNEKQVNHDNLHSNLYNYENDDENYYNKYEYDLDSKCYKQYTTSDHDLINNGLDYINNTNHMKETETKNTEKKGLITTFLPTANHINEARHIPIHTTPTVTKEAKIHYIYNMLNRQRLDLIDLLLKFDADKNLFSYLSTSCFKQLNKKCQFKLRKWYEIKKLNKSHIINNEISNLRPFSPIMAALCFDDIEIFSRLYTHHQALSSYFKPDEYLNLLNNAIRFQSESCLMFLLSKSKHSKNLDKNLNNNNKTFHQSTKLSYQHNFQSIDQNVNIMFYIIDNTRSSKIISVLLKCDYDLTKREPSTGNTVLHCLLSGKMNDHFNNGFEINDDISFKDSANTKLNESDKIYFKHSKKLDEFSAAKNLSEILFILLKHGELKSFVNNVNYENKLCMQMFFEWPELIDSVCFIDINDNNREQWKLEFKECVSFLLKSGANIFVPNKDEQHGQCFNCIDTLIKSILQRTDTSEFHSCISQTLTGTSANLITQSSNKDSAASLTSIGSAKKNQNSAKIKRHIDIKFIIYFLDKIIKLDTICDGLKRSRQASTLSFKRTYLHKCYQSTQSLISFDENQKRYNSLIGNLLQIFMRSHFSDFENAFKLLKLLCRFEQKLVVLAHQEKVALIDPNIIKKFLNQWIAQPNFLSSSKQFEKNYFVKSCIVFLITQNFIDPNDCFTYYNENDTLISNNLLNHCVHLVSSCKSAYQLELMFDFTRTLIQYGANPNLDPYAFNSTLRSHIVNVKHHANNHRSSSPSFIDTLFKDEWAQCLHSSLKRSKSILSQLCDSVKINGTFCNFGLEHTDYLAQINYQTLQNNQPHLPQISSCLTYTYELISNTSENLDDVLICEKYDYSNSIDFVNQVTEAVSSDNFCEYNGSSKRSRSNSPILLITPTPSYESFILFASGPYSSQNANNIMINSSLLLLNHYKSFIRLLYNVIDASHIQKYIRFKIDEPNHNSHLSNHNHHRFEQHRQSLLDDTKQAKLKIISSHTLDSYLEQLSSTPRTLKSITRRVILNQIAYLNEAKLHNNKNLQSHNCVNRIDQLRLPNKLRDYLLFIE